MYITSLTGEYREL